jgi:hypothetical protein
MWRTEVTTATILPRAAFGCALALGACAYGPGSFHYTTKTFPGQRVTLGCLDLSIDRRADLTDHAAVIEYDFGNRCREPAVVDLATVRVVGRTESGFEVALAPFDPKGEIGVLRIDGRLAGGEAIAYPSGLPLAQVCVDIATIAHAAPARWVCLAEPAAAPIAEVGL